MKLCIVLVLNVLLGAVATAQHQTFTVNPDKSGVSIKLKTTHEVVKGSFHVRSGSITFDRVSSQMSGSVIVAADSGKTGNDSRDRKMNKDVLKADQFTTVSFAPKTYQGEIQTHGECNIRVTGLFTLLGTPHEMTIPMQVHLDESGASATAHFIIPYVQWGLKNPSFLIWKAENDVAVDLTLVGRIDDGHVN